MLAGHHHQSAPRAFGRGGLGPQARLVRLRIGVWLVGLTGFAGLLIASRYLPHPDGWRAVAIGWFLAAGALYGVLALKRR
jgi:hypothetical protein